MSAEHDDGFDRRPPTLTPPASGGRQPSESEARETRGADAPRSPAENYDEPRDLDRRPQPPPESARLTDADHSALEDVARREDEAAFDALRDEVIASPSVFGLPNLLGHPMIGAALLGMAAVLGLFAFNQAAYAVAQIQAMTGVWYYLSWAGFGLLALALALAAARFALGYYRLRRNKQFRLKSLEELSKRTHLRHLAQRHVREAREHLSAYLAEFPLDADKGRKRLAASGVADAQIQRLTSARAKLREPSAWGSDEQWLAAFSSDFQAASDEAADARVKYWSRRAALATAVSPNALIDTAAVMTFGFLMVGDLCRIYNLRADRTGTAVILFRLMVHGYLAGQLQNAEGLAESAIQDYVIPHLPINELLLQKVFTKLSAKVGVAAANYFLISRLGRYAVRILRPVDVR